MEDARRKARVDAFMMEQLEEVFLFARAAAGDDGHIHPGSDRVQHLKIEAGADTVGVNAVQADLPRAMRSVEGTVRHGEGIGKKSLFPTANLIPEEHIIALKRGVYATRAHLPNGETCVGVTNVGVRPTVSDKNTVTIETYLVGFDGDLYGQKLQLDFFDYLREEKKFSSTRELHDMIAKNAREAEMIVK